MENIRFLIKNEKRIPPAKEIQAPPIRINYSPLTMTPATIVNSVPLGDQQSKELTLDLKR